MPKIKEIIEKSDTPLGKAFDLFIQGMIIISLISFSLETLPGLSEKTRTWLHLFELVSIAIFTIEYLFRLAVATQKTKFIFSFFGIIDLLAILPFYLSLGIDLRSLRALRLLRLVRILKLARYNSAMLRLHRAFILAREELVLFFFAAIIILYLAGVGIYYFENPYQPDVFKSIFHSLWWAVATLTTVGYGDIYPITVGGKVFTFVVLLIGLGVVSMPAGIMASALSEAREME